jgi:hypothetical protein
MNQRSGSSEQELKTLLFVYNTDSSVLQALRDYTACPSAASRSGNCTLCALTHSPVGMKKEWKRFIRDLEIPSQFLNRNEFLSEFGDYQHTFPAVFLRKGTELVLLICSGELSRCQTLRDIISLIEYHLQSPARGIRVVSGNRSIRENISQV